MSGRRVGIIGGGQLAWMMAAAADKLEIELVVQTPHLQDPAAAIAQQVVLAAVSNAAATAELAALSDVITFENEFVDLPALEQLAARGVRFRPSLKTLVPILDKFEQRTFFQRLGIPTPNFLAVDRHSDPVTLSQFGFPVVLKARRHGYDGQGTHVCRSLQELQAHLSGTSPDAWLLEEFVPFVQELAVMVARSDSGAIVVYPVVETQQENQVCQRVLITQTLAPAVVDQVEEIARSIVSQLAFVGIMGIELFLTATGAVSVNELAPRTHNSGHYSLDACVTSQFEQQLRAVCDRPLGSPALTYASAVMVNLLGFESVEFSEEPKASVYRSQRQQIEQIPNARLYWYGKTGARPGRKLGHVTVCARDPLSRSEAEALAATVEACWYGDR